MHKKYLITGMMLAVLPAMVQAQDVDANVKQGISDYFTREYKNVEVVNENGEVKVTFPKIEIKKYNSLGEEKGVNTLPSYSVKLEDKGDFLGYKQYGAKFDNPDRVKGVLYQFIMDHLQAKGFNNGQKIDFDIFPILGELNNLSIGTYTENATLLPEFAVATQRQINAQNISYDVYNELTKMNENFFKVQNMEIKNEFVPQETDIRQEMSGNIDNVDINSPLGWVKIPNMNWQNFTTYDKNLKDLGKILTFKNISSFQKSNAQYNGKFLMDFMGYSFNYNVAYNAVAERQKDPAFLSFKIKSVSSLKQDLDPKYNIDNLQAGILFSNISVKSLEDMIELSQQIENFSEQCETEDPTILQQCKKEEAYLESKMYRIFNSLASVKIKSKIEADFANNSSIKAWINVKELRDFVIADIRIDMTNIEKLFPEVSAMCDEKSKSDPSLAGVCATDYAIQDMKAELRKGNRKTLANGDVVDVITIKATKDGVYKNGQKISDPIVVNGEDMLTADSLPNVGQ